MTSFVLSPLSPPRDSALVGHPTGSTIGWDMICTVLELSETDIGKLLLRSTCFSSAPGSVLCYKKAFLVCLAGVDVPACWIYFYRKPW